MIPRVQIAAWSVRFVSYGQFLLIFLVAPVVALILLLRRRVTGRFVLGTALLAIVAFIYTTPWDNAIVWMGVWTYDPSLIVGVILGVVPLEEYLFYFLQTILTSLVLLAIRNTRVGP